MNLLPSIIIVLGVAVMTAFAIWRPVLFNKLVLVKRINPEHTVKEGDFAFKGTVFQVRMKWLTKDFRLNQITTIKLYYNPDFGDGGEDENCIDVVFEDGTTALLDASNKDHQQLLDNILLALRQNTVDWSTLLPVDSEKAVLYKAPLPLT